MSVLVTVKTRDSSRVNTEALLSLTCRKDRENAVKWERGAMWAHFSDVDAAHKLAAKLRRHLDLTVTVEEV